MPTYVYRCKECGITFERSQHFSEEPIKECPECNAEVYRVMQPVGIVFKGRGFYVNDHGKRSATLPGTPSDREEKAGCGKDDANGGGSDDKEASPKAKETKSASDEVSGASKAEPSSD